MKTKQLIFVLFSTIFYFSCKPEIKQKIDLPMKNEIVEKKEIIEDTTVWISTKIDYESLNEMTDYVDKISEDIYTYYSVLQDGDYKYWSNKMFGRCCTEADLTISDVLKFSFKSNIDNKSFPISNINDFEYLTTYAFREGQKPKIKLKIDWKNEYTTYFGVDESKIKSKDTILFPFKLSLINGYAKSKKVFENNSRVKEMDVFLNNIYKGTILLMDTVLIQEFEANFAFLKNDVVTLQPISYYNGLRYDDVCISEIQTCLGEITYSGFRKKFAYNFQ